MLRSTADPESIDVQHLEWTQSPAPVVDEDGGQFGLAIGIIDVEDGAVASSDIDISSATAELAKSTGGGSFSTSGITQPSLSKSDGVVVLETDFDEAEWAAGDSYRVTVSGISATTGDGNTVELPEQRWYGGVSEESDITGQINTLHNTRIPDVISLSNIQGEVEDGLEKDIANLSPASGSVADLLNSNLDTTVSSRSSHGDPDPNGHIDAAISSRQAPPSNPDTGTLSADGTEQTVFTRSPSETSQVHYYISLGNMASGDTVVVREKVDVTGDGTFETFASETFNDAQSEPVVGPSANFMAQSGTDVRVTLEQTAGTNRNFDHAEGEVR